MKAGAPVLVSWIAVGNDPYERNPDRSYRAAPNE